MPPRQSWKAFLRLSLVSVPVLGYNAEESGECEIHLNQLHDQCHSRIRYEKVCPIHGPVSSKEIVSGYPYAKDQYVVIDPEELDKLRTEADKAINIDAFVEPDAVDPVYLDGRMYYLTPDGPAGRKPYAVLYRAMRELKRNAVGQAVLFGKEQLFLLRPYDGLLMMAMLNPERCMRSPGVLDFDVDRVEVSAEERKLAETLLRASSPKQFDLSKYENVYVERLRALIEAKVEGKELVAPPPVEEPQIVNLMDALRESVARAEGNPKQVAGKAQPKRPSRSKKPRKAG